MKILFVFPMLAASWAYAEDPTSDDYHAMAVVLAKCSGYWKAMIPPMKRKNNSATVEKLQDTVYSWEPASRMMFSAAHEPEDTRSYEAWKQMAGEYVEAGRMHMAFLLEEANSKEDNEAADKVMKDQVEGSSPSRPTTSQRNHRVMALRPGDRSPLVCAVRGLPIGLPRPMSTGRGPGTNTKGHPRRMAGACPGSGNTHT